MDRGAWRTIYSMGCKESCIYLHNWATQAYRHTAPGTNATSGPPRWVSGSSLSRGKWSTQLGTGYAWVLSGVVIQCGHQGAPRIRTISTFFFFAILQVSFFSIYKPAPSCIHSLLIPVSNHGNKHMCPSCLPPSWMHTSEPPAQYSECSLEKWICQVLIIMWPLSKLASQEHLSKSHLLLKVYFSISPCRTAKVNHVC